MNGDAERQPLETRERARLGWMALTLTPEMGPTRIAKAVARLGAAERVFEASLDGARERGPAGAGGAVCLRGPCAAGRGEGGRAEWPRRAEIF